MHKVKKIREAQKILKRLGEEKEKGCSAGNRNCSSDYTQLNIGDQLLIDF